MENSTESTPIVARLSARSRVVVATDSSRHGHALRQLRYYLADRQIEVVNITEFPNLG